MPDPTPPAPGGSRFGVIGLVTLIGSALIGFNTLVTSCASEDAASNAAMLHAAEEDERFWTSAIQDLADMTGEKGKEGENFEARCAFLASRTAPFVADFTLEKASVAMRTGRPDKVENAGDDGLTPETRELTKRVRLLRDEFVRSIADENQTSSACKASYELALIRAQTEQATEEREQLAGPKPERSGQKAQAKPALPRDPLIELSDLSSKGWDVDVFWCEDTDDTATATNFTQAHDFAEKLAGFANNGQRLVGKNAQFEIGRVRLRRLAEVLWQRQPEYSGVNGLAVLRYGASDRGEKDLADAILAQQFGSMLQLENAPGTRTPWYISVYFCRANIGTAVAPDAAVAKD